MKLLKYIILALSALCSQSVAAQSVTALADSARHFRSLGEFPKSARYYSRILERLPADASFDTDRIYYSSPLTDVLLILGDYEGVEKLLSDSIYSSDPVLQINLAAALGYQSKYDDAIAILDKVYTQCPDVPSLKGKIIQNKGFMESDRGNYEGAERCFSEASRFLSDVDADYLASNRALNLARLGRYDEALSMINDVLKSLRKRGPSARRDYIRAQRKQAEILFLKGDKRAAASTFRNYFNAERTRIADQFDQMTPSARLNLWFAEKPLLSKCFLLEDYDADFMYEVAMYRRLTSLFGMRDLSKLKGFLNITPSDIKRSLDKSGAAIEFIGYTDAKGEDAYAALILTSKGPARFVKLFPDRFIYDNNSLGNKSIFDVIKSERPEDKNRLYNDSAIGNAIWGPILASLPKEVRKISFAPEGIFHIWGIESMPFEGKEQYSFRRLTTTASLASPLEKSSGDEKYSKGEALLVGGLHYSSTPSDSPTEHADREASEAIRAQVGKTNIFSYLPGTRREVDSISAIMNGAVSLYQIGEGELKKTFPDYRMVHLATHGYSLNLGLRKRPEAMADSLVFDRSLNACGLALSGANVLSETAGGEDGILSAREICALDLSDVDIVILSACQTAQGDVVDEGAAGLVRGLKNAGVNTVIATLWSVNDNSTMLFMQEFHRLLDSGKTKREAFAGAQRALRDGNHKIARHRFSARSLSKEKKPTYVEVDYKEPYYWAPFILIDD